MLRRGIATSESVAEAFENANAPLSYGATPESWAEALTKINEADITFAATDETFSEVINKETEGHVVEYTVDITFTHKGKVVDVDSATLNGVVGVKEGDHYEFANLSGELVDVKLSYVFDGDTYEVTKSYSNFTDDVVSIKKSDKKDSSTTEYVVTEDTEYLDGKDYYTRDDDVYTKLVAGTDYEVGDIITGTVYEIKA